MFLGCLLGLVCQTILGCGIVKFNRSERSDMTNIPEHWIGQPGPVQQTMLGVSVSYALRDAIRAAAEREGVTASYWMRRVAVEALRKEKKAVG